MTDTTSHHRLHRAQRRPTWRRPRAFYALGLRLGVQRLRRRTTPASAHPTATARSAASTPAGAPRRRRRPRCCSTPTTSTPRVAAVDGRGRRDHRGALRVPGRPALPLRRPRAATCSGVCEPAAVSPAATPRASRRRRGRAGRRGRAAAARPARGSISYAVSAPPSSSSARSTIASACSPRAARSTQRGGRARRARRRVGRCRRFISSSATSGRQRATSRSASASAALEQRGAQLAVGLADVGQLARARPGAHCQTTAAPDARPAPGPSRRRSSTTASPASSAAALNAARAAEPDRVARRRAAPAPTPVAPRARSAPRPATSGAGAVAEAARRRARRRRRRPRRARASGDHVAAQPGRAPPARAAAETGSGLVTAAEDTRRAGRRRRLLDRVTPMAAVLEFADVTRPARARRRCSTRSTGRSRRTSAGWSSAPTAPARPRCCRSPPPRSTRPRASPASSDEVLGTVDVFELRPRIGLTSAALAERIPRDELVHDVVVSASYGVVGPLARGVRRPRPRPRRRAAAPRSAPSTWPTAPSAPSARASASGSRSPAR